MVFDYDFRASAASSTPVSSPAPQPTPQSPNRLLLVDDNPAICQFVTRVARQFEYEVTAVHGLGDFVKALPGTNPTLCLVDLQLQDSDGVQVLSVLGDAKCKAPIALMSGFDPGVLQSVERFGRERGLNIVDRFEKPIVLDRLRALFERSKCASPLDPTQDLRRGIENGEVIPHYQPKVCLQTRDVVGVEALARWMHPVRGPVSPGEFIPLAETSGLIRPLTDAILERALQDQATWEATGRPMSVAVNVSAMMVQDRSFADQVIQAVRRHRVKPERLVLEVTESTAMGDIALALEVFNRIRLAGIGLAIDDFGTGYSNLVALQKMPFSELKIDCSFVFEMLTNPDTARIVDLLVQLGHGLRLKVVAEGVCSASIFDRIKQSGADLAQGFFMSRPLPAGQLISWCDNWCGRS